MEFEVWQRAYRCGRIVRQILAVGRFLHLTKNLHSLLNASDVTNPLPRVLPNSGSNQPWLKYLWCIPGTQTYLFLNNGRLLPPPLTYRDVRGALSQAAVQAQNNLTQHGDGPITGRSYFPRQFFPTHAVL